MQGSKLVFKWCRTNTRKTLVCTSTLGLILFQIWMKNWFCVVECCFTSTETISLFGTGAQDGHLDFHTAPEHWKIDKNLCVYIYILSVLVDKTCDASWVWFPFKHVLLTLADEWQWRKGRRIVSQKQGAAGKGRHSLWQDAQWWASSTLGLHSFACLQDCTVLCDRVVHSGVPLIVRAVAGWLNCGTGFVITSLCLFPENDFKIWDQRQELCSFFVLGLSWLEEDFSVL